MTLDVRSDCRMRNRELVATLTAMAENTDIPRETDHRLFFRDRSSRSCAGAEAEEIGFQIRELYSTDDMSMPFGLQLFHETSVDLSTMDSVTDRLVEIAAKFGGVYDGWETFVMGPDVRSAVTSMIQR